MKKTEPPFNPVLIPDLVLPVTALLGEPIRRTIG